MVELKKRLSRRYWGFRAFFYALYYKIPLLSAISRREHQSLQKLWNSCPEKPDGVHLDLACGSKPVVIAGNFHLRIGLDASLTMLRYAAGVTNSYDYIAGDGLNLPFKDGTLSVVTAAGLTEYLDSPDLFLGEMYRVLQNRGMVIFSFSHPNLLNKLRKLWNPKVYLRDEEEWKTMTGANRFEFTARRMLLLQTQFSCKKEEG